MDSRAPAARWIEIRPRRGFRWPHLGELWQYRELAIFLALRDLKVRYKQALLGMTWAVIQPLAGALVLTVVFHRLARVPSSGIPYPVFALAGLTAWTYVSSGVTRATQSLVTNSPLVTKVYFPRLIAPLASALPGLVDLLISLVILGVLMPIYGVHPTLTLLTVPLWVLAAVLIVLGLGLLMGTLNVRYRDINHIVTLFVQLWIFLTPVAYPSSLVPSSWRFVYFLNPMAGVIEGFRWALVGAPWPGPHVYVSLTVALSLLIAGVAYFERAERRFADVI